MASTAPPLAGNDVDLAVRPTVFIGLGGTGMEVLLRLRRRILAERWNGQQLESLADFPIAAFLHFDTDSRATVQSGINPEEDPYLKLISLDSDAIRANGFRPGRFQASIDNYPYLRDWLPSESLAQINTDEGAAQIRAVSRLMFFDRIAAFDSEVRKRAAMVTANLNNRETLDRLGLAPDKKLRAVVVAGLGGGTGAGAFIDAGLFLRAITGTEFGEVDAYLMLPSGFHSFGARTQANGFAALTELEHAMRKASPPFVESWSASFRPSIDANRQRPFSNVYLFDVANIESNRSNRPEPIFEMMADSLFEDFGTSGFAERKRSARSNKAEAKAKIFRPAAIDGDTSLRGFEFSSAYSSIGQARLTTRGALALDEAAEIASQKMLSSFFGVALAGDSRKAQPKDRDRFLDQALGLGPRIYGDFPPHLKPLPPAITARRLCDMILSGAGVRALDAELVDVVNAEFESMRLSLANPSDWTVNARRLAEEFKGQVLPAAGAPALRERKVADGRAALARRWFSNDASIGSGSLLDALFQRIDDRAQGGVDFTISLIADVREALERGDGPIAQLETAAVELERVAEKLHEASFNSALDSVDKALKLRFLAGADLDSAETYLKSAANCLAEGLAFRLRARAAREGAALLLETIEKLGRRVPNTEAMPRWSGLLGKLHAYRDAVERLIADAARERSKIQDLARTGNTGTALVVEDNSAKEPIQKVLIEAETWADESFRSLGQCRALLPRLERGDGAFEVLNALRNSARHKLDALRNTMPSITDALAALPAGKADALLGQLMSWAMPWIEISNDSDFKPNYNDQCQLLLATGDTDGFLAHFGGRLNQLAPEGLKPEMQPSGSSSELIAYCEISGFPLDWLAGMRDAWKREYQATLLGHSDSIYPVHVHKDQMRFAMPLVPTVREITHLKADLALLFRASLLGVVQRRASGEWQINLSPGRQPSWLAIGSETEIRRRSIAATVRAALETQVAAAETALGPLTLTALIQLTEHLAHDVYAPRKIKGGQGEQEIYGFGFKVARTLIDDWKAQRSAQMGDAAMKLPAWEAWLRANPDSWSQAVIGSANDAPTVETDARSDRRRLNDSLANEAALRKLLEPATIAPPPPPPPPMAGKWWLHSGGTTTGPFGFDQLADMLGGALNADTQLCPVGSQQWQTAAQTDGVGALFAPPPPPR